MWKLLLSLFMIGTPVKITIAKKHYNVHLDWYELSVGYDTPEMYGSTVIQLIPSPSYLWRRIQHIRHAKPEVYTNKYFSVGPALHPTEAQKRAEEWDRAAGNRKSDGT